MGNCVDKCKYTYIYKYGENTNITKNRKSN